MYGLLIRRGTDYRVLSDIALYESDYRDEGWSLIGRVELEGEFPDEAFIPLQPRDVIDTLEAGDLPADATAEEVVVITEADVVDLGDLGIVADEEI